MRKHLVSAGLLCIGALFGATATYGFTNRDALAAKAANTLIESSATVPAAPTQPLPQTAPITATET